MGASHQGGLDAALRRAAEARVARLSAAERGERGVVHTPIELARHMARAVDRALRERGEPGGLEGDVVVIDPACGPGVFVAAAREVGARRVVGLDLDARALGDARAILDEAGLAEGVRLLPHDTLAGPAPLDEAERAARWRVVLGNPPWASRSANRAAAFTERLLDDFRREPDGRPLRERKRGVLSDDYVRFWRWACEEALGAAGAVVALVTNASYLDGPVHRGMRACLTRWFSEIAILDLGGSALVARRGGRDENLFGVRPGAAVTTAVRPPGATGPARIRRAELRGTVVHKLDRLGEGGAEGVTIDPPGPLFAWARPSAAAPRYEAWPSLPELMPFHREGVQTNRDAFCLDRDRDRLIARLRDFAERGGEQPGRAHLATRHYDPEAAREAIRGADLDRAVRPLAYRPHERRWAALIPKVCHRPRRALLDAMDASSLALLTVRKDRGERLWAHFGACRHPVDNCWLSSRSSCRTRAFPTHRPDGAPNVSELAVAWGLADGPTLVRYALAVLAARSYRERYDSRLRLDYPRIPPPGPEAEALIEAGDAIARALIEGAPRGDEHTIGHRAVRSGALGEALAAADEAVRPRIEIHRR